MPQMWRRNWTDKVSKRRDFVEFALPILVPTFDLLTFLINIFLVLSLAEDATKKIWVFLIVL